MNLSVPLFGIKVVQPCSTEPDPNSGSVISGTVDLHV